MIEIFNRQGKKLDEFSAISEDGRNVYFSNSHGNLDLADGIYIFSSPGYKEKKEIIFGDAKIILDKKISIIPVLVVGYLFYRLIKEK